MQEMGLILGLGRSPEEGKGYQYSGLENSMNHIIYGVIKSQTGLGDFQYFFCDLENYQAQGGHFMTSW